VTHTVVPAVLGDRGPTTRERLHRDADSLQPINVEDQVLRDATRFCVPRSHKVKLNCELQLQQHRPQAELVHFICN